MATALAMEYRLTSDLSHALFPTILTKSALDKYQSDLDIRCLREAYIIGETTSELARKPELLQRMRAEAMLCEAAGEVLEAPQSAESADESSMESLPCRRLVDRDSCPLRAQGLCL